MSVIQAPPEKPASVVAVRYNTVHENEAEAVCLFDNLENVLHSVWWQVSRRMQETCKVGPRQFTLLTQGATYPAGGELWELCNLGALGAYLSI